MTARLTLADLPASVREEYERRVRVADAANCEDCVRTIADLREASADAYLSGALAVAEAMRGGK